MLAFGSCSPTVIVAPERAWVLAVLPAVGASLASEVAVAIDPEALERGTGTVDHAHTIWMPGIGVGTVAKVSTEIADQHRPKMTGRFHAGRAHRSGGRGKSVIHYFVFHRDSGLACRLKLSGESRACKAFLVE